jgi:hypothetical protein
MKIILNHCLKIRSKKMSKKLFTIILLTFAIFVNIAFSQNHSPKSQNGKGVFNPDDYDYYAKLKKEAVEIIEKRTEFAKTYQNSDGTYTAVISTRPIHYKDKGGNWKEIEYNKAGYQTNSEDWFTTEKEISIYKESPSNVCGEYPFNFSVGKKTINNSQYYVYRHVVKWNATGVIPEGSDITTALFELVRAGNTPTSGSIGVYKIVKSLSTVDCGLWDDAGDGTLYQTMDMDGIGKFVFQNNASFNYTLENQRWIAIGLKNTDESDDSKYINFTTSNLFVRYTKPNLALSTSSWSAPAGGGTQSVSVTNNTTDNSIRYNVSVDVSWLSVSSTSGSTPGSFTITAQANPTTSSRTGKVKVTSASNPSADGSPAVITITQAPASSSPPVTITGPTQLVSGQIGTFTASTNVQPISYKWYQSYNGTNWSLVRYVTSTSTSDQLSISGSGSFYLRVEVKDDAFVTYTDDHYVRVIFDKQASSGIKNTPKDYVLAQNHPNPFNPTTSISFSLPKDEHVVLSIYNITGQLVRTLVNERKNAGTHSIMWNGRNESGAQVTSGLYIYKIKAGSYTQVRKMSLMK